MAFIVDETNVDYLIGDVRLRYGDFVEPYRYSDTIVRTAVVNAVKYLQRKWYDRYQVVIDGTIIEPQPAGVPAGYVYAATAAGYQNIPSGLGVGDVYRNPATTFVSAPPPIVEQDDEAPIVIAACIALRTAQLTSSADSFQSWSTADMSYTNSAGSKVLTSLLEQDLAALESFFKTRLSGAKRDSFNFNLISGVDI